MKTSSPAIWSPSPAGNSDDDVTHDEAAVEIEDCIMNNAAPIDAALGIPSRTPPRPARAR
jgi:hypothetical protein